MLGRTGLTSVSLQTLKQTRQGGQTRQDCWDPVRVLIAVCLASVVDVLPSAVLGTSEEPRMNGEEEGSEQAIRRAVERLG